MKAGIISPYFKTLGGGERYALTFAQALLDKGWEVDISINSPEIVEEARKRFSLKLENLKMIDFNHLLIGNFFKKFAFQKKYDLLFWVSDGSIPWMFSQKNILHFQIPFHNLGGKSFLNSLKFKKINAVVCNSFFTKKVIDREYGIRSDVWYPPVSIDDIAPGNKKNYILAVSRFEKSMTEKRHDILIETFKEMINKEQKGWKLILCGGCTVGNDSYLSSLKEMAKGFDIEFKVNLSFSELKKTYAEAKIFWHAAGYGVDEEKFPEKTEHFGMTTVEAMAAGCVPVVLGKGGQKEIVEDGKNGFLWIEKNQLSQKTLDLIKNEKQLAQLSENAIIRSKNFSKEIFNQKIYGLI